MFIICRACAQPSKMRAFGICQKCYLSNYHNPNPTTQSIIASWPKQLKFYSCMDCSGPLSVRTVKKGICKNCTEKRHRSTHKFKEYMAHKAREWRANNPDKVLKTNKKRAEYSAKWHEKNKQRRNKAASDNYKNNKGEYIRRSRARRTKLNALLKTLPDAHKRLIRDFYANCPPGYHVDHILPLKGLNVSGLHVIWNLQYLPAQENLKKGNKVEST
jgi:hypothetical protein